MYDIMLYEIKDAVEKYDIQERYYMGPRMYVTFKNGYEVSIIAGEGAYGTKNMPFEMAIIYDGEIVSVPGIVEHDVEGYLTQDEVVEKLHNVARLLPPQTKEVMLLT